MVESGVAKPSAAPALAQLTAAGLLGLVGLPALLAPGDPLSLAVLTALLGAGPVGPIVGLAWLVLALLVCVWLLAISPGLAHAVAGASDVESPSRLPGPGLSWAAAAWALVAVCFILLAEAILRRPLVVVLGGQLGAGAVEATFAASALALLLLALYWLYRGARPLVAASTRRALDALVATSGSEVASPALPSARVATRPASGVEATRPGGAASAGPVTVVAGQVAGGDDATRPGGEPSGEATVLPGRLPEAGEAAQPAGLAAVGPAGADDAPRATGLGVARPAPATPADGDATQVTGLAEAPADETRPAGR